MKTKKKFDCVEMKNRIQQQLQQEYESHKDEFASFADFIKKSNEKNPKWAGFWDKIAKKK